MRSPWLVVPMLLSAPMASDPAAGQITPRPEQIEELLKGPADTPVVMVNLLRFKEAAGEPDVGLTGEQAYARYGAQMIQWVVSQGGRLLWSGRVDSMLIGDTQEYFHVVALVEYPSRQAFLKIAGDPRVQEYSVHRTAGLQMQWLLATTEADLPALPPDDADDEDRGARAEAQR